MRGKWCDRWVAPSSPLPFLALCSFALLPSGLVLVPGFFTLAVFPDASSGGNAVCTRSSCRSCVLQSNNRHFCFSFRVSMARRNVPSWTPTPAEKLHHLLLYSIFGCVGIVDRKASNETILWDNVLGDESSCSSRCGSCCSSPRQSCFTGICCVASSRERKKVKPIFL